MEPSHRTTPFTPSAKQLTFALVAGALLVTSALHDGRPPQPSAGQRFAASTVPTKGSSTVPTTGPSTIPTTGPSARPKPSRGAPAPGPSVRPLPRAEPVRLRIAAIGVNAPMTELGLDAKGALRPPPADVPDLVGWYGKGPVPGSTGTAVAVGHVDLRTGSRGVFYDLGSVTKGDAVEITRSDERTAVFTVDAVEVYAKKSFPNEKVYGSSGRPELRLITCGGGYARNTGYQGNVVVYATLTAAREPTGRSPV
ncbi:class F sortase [Streptomyces sp. NBC_01275]|uniref:class F sortase n=1 Tax=Streptomyces sp. NBC_01275 TaxID=2903807 RepID=UPI0022534961|nr:class F sortase [Streptomyces sp. NBC_01275]MCX4759786.1 class F sortase [Streptomyces sp. NBC_01275]